MSLLLIDFMSLIITFAIGFYRVNYDEITWILITRALRGAERTVIHEYNRAQVCIFYQSICFILNILTLAWLYVEIVVVLQMFRRRRLFAYAINIIL